MERRQFIHCTNLCGAGLLGLGAAASVQAAPGKSTVSKAQKPLTMRPYQLLCTICSLGEEGADSAKQYAKCRKNLEILRKNPDGPVTLTCRAGAMFDYQDSGAGENTPEGDEFNMKRDLDVLQLLDVEPGSTMPARPFSFMDFTICQGSPKSA